MNGGGVVGKNCYIGTRNIDLAHAWLIKIGDNVTLSSCRLLVHDASTKRAIGYSKVGRIIIGNNVFVGADALILPNVKIGNDCIIGAGAVVTSDVEDNSVVCGVPAKRICSYDEYIEKNRVLFETAPHWDTHYSKKSDSEKRDMQQKLMNGGIGFDI
ncbi:UNVERIFIED_CONTAM: acyltransferase [Bacteroidetes bacterium 56_B9]